MARNTGRISENVRAELGISDKESFATPGRQEAQIQEAPKKTEPAANELEQGSTVKEQHPFAQSPQQQQIDFQETQIQQETPTVSAVNQIAQPTEQRAAAVLPSVQQATTPTSNEPIVQQNIQTASSEEQLGNQSDLLPDVSNDTFDNSLEETTNTFIPFEEGEREVEITEDQVKSIFNTEPSQTVATRKAEKQITSQDVLTNMKYNSVVSKAKEQSAIPASKKIETNEIPIPNVKTNDLVNISFDEGKIIGPVTLDSRIGINQVAIGEETLFELLSGSENIPNLALCYSENSNVVNSRTIRTVQGKGIYLHPTQSSMYSISDNTGYLTVDMTADPSSYNTSSEDYFTNPSIDLEYWPTYDQSGFILNRQYELNDYKLYDESLIEKARVVIREATSDRASAAATENAAEALKDFNFALLHNDSEYAKETWANFIKAIERLRKDTWMSSSTILQNVYNISLNMKKLGIYKDIPSVVDNIDVRFRLDPDVLRLMNLVEQYIDDSGVHSSSIVKTSVLIGAYNDMFPGGINVEQAMPTLEYLGIEIDSLDTEKEIENFVGQLAEYIYDKKQDELLSNMNSQEKTAEFIRQEVLRRVGFPNSTDGNGNKLYSTYQQFIQAFILAYDRSTYLIETVDQSRIKGFSYLGIEIGNSSKFAPRFESLRYSTSGQAEVDTNELAMAIFRIYQNADFYKVFPMGEVDTSTLSDNMKNFYNVVTAMDQTKSTYSFCFENNFSKIEAEHKTNDPRFNQIDIAAAMTDIYSQLSEQFYSQTYESSPEYLSLQNSNGHSREEIRKELIDVKRFLGPEIVGYFGITTKESLTRSPFIENLNNLRESRLAMVVDMRVAPLRNSYNNYINISKDESATDEQKNSALNELTYEYKRLNNSSIIWNSILHGGGSIYGSKAMAPASIIEILTDVKNFSFEEKMDILIDVIKNNFAREVTYSDIAFGLEIDPNPIRPIQTLGASSAVDIKTASINAYSGVEKINILDYSEDADYMTLHNQEEQNALVDMVNQVIDNPYRVFSIDDKLAGEAISSILSGSENYRRKAEAFCNAVHEITGRGFSSDTISNCNESLGIYNIEKLSPRKIVSILSNREDVLIYDNSGKTYSIADLNDLVHSRRFVNLFRKTKHNGSSFVTNDSIMTEGFFDYEFMQDEESLHKASISYVKNELLQHPTYCAMLTFFLDEGETSTVNKIARAQNRLADIFLYLSSLKQKQSYTDEKILDEFYRLIGLVPPRINQGSLINFSEEQNVLIDAFALMDRAVLKYTNEIPERFTNYAKKPEPEKRKKQFNGSMARFFVVRDTLISANNSLSIRSNYENIGRNAIAASLLDDGFTYVYADNYPGEINENTERFTANEKEILKVPLSEYNRGNIDSRGRLVGQLLSLSMTKPESNIVYSSRETYFGYPDGDNFTNAEVLKNKESLSSVLARINGQLFADKNKATYELAVYLYNNSSLQHIDNFDELNFMSLAELMLIQDETGKFSIRPFDAISDYIFDTMSTEMISDISPLQLKETIANQLDQVVLTENNTTASFNPIAELLPITKSKGPKLSNFRTNASVREEIELLNDLIESYPNQKNIKQPTKRAIEKANKGAKNSLSAHSSLIESIEKNTGTATGNMIDSSTMQIPLFGKRFVNVLVQSGDDKTILNSFRESYRRGNTVIISGNLLKSVPESMRQYIKPYDLDYYDYPLYSISFFDVRLDNYRVGSNNLNKMTIDTMYAAPEEQLIVVDDLSNTLSTNDSPGAIFNNAKEKLINVNSYIDTFSVEDMFADTTARYPYTKIEYSLPDPAEIALIKIKDIDFGIDPNTNRREYGERKKAFEEMNLARFSYKMAQNGGISPSPSEQGIVGFVCATLSNGTKKYAPILLRNFSDSSDIRSINLIEKEGGKRYVNIQYYNKIEKNTIEFKSGTGSATQNLKFYNGNNSVAIGDRLKADAFVSTFDNNVNQRFASMEALVRVAGMLQYNIALMDGFNPKGNNLDEQFSYKLLHNELTMDDWNVALSDNSFSLLDDKFDDDTNRFLIIECKKLYNRGVNPTLFLSSHHASKSNAALFVPNRKTYNLAEQFESSIEYMNKLLRFINKIDPSLCPPSIDAPNKGELFKVNTEVGPYNNCLQIRTKDTSVNIPVYRNVQVVPVKNRKQDAVIGLSGQNGIDKNLDALNSFVYDEVINSDDTFKELVLAEARKRQMITSNGFIG